MLILAVDTSTRRGSVAVLRDAEVVAEIAGYEETPYSSRLFRAVDELQTWANFSLDQVDLFAVAAGPGSFTGLRVGLTAVKGWAEVHRKPIAAISGLHAIAAESQTGGTPRTLGGTTDTRFIASFLDARRGQIFGAIYKGSGDMATSLTLESEESIVSPNEFLEMVSRRSASWVDFASPTPEAIPVSLVQQFFPGVHVIPVSPALAPAIGRLGFERAGRGDLSDAVHIDANYVRRSDAEAAWRDV